MNQKVSIIVPVYNVYNYLEKSVNSILNQDYPNIEVILVDDGSTDGCGELCDNYVKKDSRIVVVHRENGGLSAARNSGLEVATGELCLFVDSDDYLEPNVLNQLVQTYVSNDLDFMAFGKCAKDEDGNVVERKKLWEELFEFSSLEDKMKFLCGKYLSNRLGFEVWCKMYSMKIIRENHMEFAPNKEIFAEDICFISEYLLYCNKVMVVPIEVYNYLQRGSSIMGGIKDTQVLRIIKLCAYLEKKYEIKPEYEKVFPYVAAGIVGHEFWQHNTNSVIRNIDISEQKEKVIKWSNLAIEEKGMIDRYYDGYLKPIIILCCRYFSLEAKKKYFARNIVKMNMYIIRFLRAVYRSVKHSIRRLSHA